MSKVRRKQKISRYIYMICKFIVHAERMSCITEGEISIVNVTYDNYLAQFTGGSFSITGRVAACQNGVYGSVCDMYWDQSDADVLCNSVGLSTRFGELLFK